MNSNQGQIQSLDRAFKLIEIIANTNEPLSLKTITELSNLPKPTVHRLLASLEAWDYVEQTRVGYKLGTKFLLLGSKVKEDLEITKVARPFIKELNEITKETVFLGVMDKGRSLYVDKMDSHHSVRLVSKVGSRNYLHSTSLGKCLLSGLAEERVLEILEENGMPALTENTVIDAQTLVEKVKAVKLQGYAVDDMENEEGVRCVAAPIKDHKGKVVAAISISGPAQRITDEAISEKLQPMVMETALKISQSLGYK